MRRLLLLRHAKAERSQPGGRDHDRILSKRGRNDAAAVGGYPVRHKLVPDRALVSTSARTRETWDLVATAFVKRPRRNSTAASTKPRPKRSLTRSGKPAPPATR